MLPPNQPHGLNIPPTASVNSLVSSLQGSKDREHKLMYPVYLIALCSLGGALIYLKHILIPFVIAVFFM